MTVETRKVCTGCGMISDTPLGLNDKGQPFLGCCPDNHYLPVLEAFKYIGKEQYNKALEDVKVNAKIGTRKAIFAEGTYDETYLIKESIDKLKK